MFKVGDIVEFICEDNEGSYGTKKGRLYKIQSSGWEAPGGVLYNFEDLVTHKMFVFFDDRVRRHKQKKSKPSWL